MKRIVFCFLLLIVFSTYTKAQDLSVVDVFGGYSYQRVTPDFLAEGANGNGWHTNLTANLKQMGGFLGLVADFSGHYGKSAGVKVSMRAALFGVRVAARGEKLTWYVQSMYGFANLHGDGDIFGPEIGRSDSSFAFMPGGGGLDVKLSDNIAFRVFELDVIHTNFGRGGGQLRPRLSTGIVFRLGKH